MFVANKLICMSLSANLLVPGVGAISGFKKIAEFVFGYCYHCGSNKLSKMAAVPQSAFAVCKHREREMKIAKVQKVDSEQEKMFYDNTYTELSPLKYNSKLMNSIWGLYNRYSVHNFKKMTDANDVDMSADSQQLAGYSAAAAEKSAGMKGQKSSTVLVSEWINIWETHKSY